MGRPRKGRKICCLPESNLFGPLDSPLNKEGYVVMTVDEYETIRLIDLEGFIQEECANQMQIARTTVQGIYNEARRKIADSLINGKILFVDGGEFKICNGAGEFCTRGVCGRRKSSGFTGDEANPSESEKKAKGNEE